MQNFDKRFADVFGTSSLTVVAADDTTKHKPEPDNIILAMNRLGLDASKVALLGDHKVDMQTGINAGVNKRIGITHGFDDTETLQAHGATYVAYSFGDIERYLRD